mmetsp:Transcript_11504/g.23577  ORF Transcript_11504/g.23577 Transcript_11504/m.23577 type:complete len:700 (+) Transcript_11504:176-2275(+)
MSIITYVCCCFRPFCGPHFANLNEIEGFTTMLTLYIFFSAMTISGFVGALGSTLQKTFGFSVFESTVVVSTTYVIVKMCGVVPLSYLCGKSSIPYHFRWMAALQGFGTLLFAFVGLMASIAEDEAGMGQFVCMAANATIDPTTGVTIAAGTENNQACKPSVEGGNKGVFFILCFAMACMAVAQCCTFTLGPAHINANSTPEECASLLCWVNGIYPMGFAVGFIGIAGMLDSGNWWMAFALSGVCTLGLVPLMMQLPAVPDKHKESASHHVIKQPEFSMTEKRSKKVADTSVDRSKERRPSSLGMISVPELKVLDFRHQVQEILFNRVWLMNVVSGSAEIAVISAVSTHGGQYLETQAGLSKGAALMLAGIVLIPAATIGTALGGKAESAWHKNLVDTSKWNMKMAALSAVFYLCFLFIGCEQPDVIGANLETGLTFTPDCALDTNGTNCGCDQAYYPVCYNNRTFFSPCHTGCSYWNDDIGAVYADNCTCADASIEGLTFDETDFNPTGLPVVEKGYCKDDQCGSLMMILGVFFIALVVTFMNNIPMNIVLMRSVPTEFSGLSLGMNDVIDKLLGDLTGSLILGAQFDTACSVKDIKIDPLSCEEIESCALFDLAEMNTHWSTLGFLGKALSFAFCCITFYFITKDPEMAKDYEEVTTKTGNFRRVSVSVHSMQQSGASSKRSEKPSVAAIQEDEEEGV